MSKDLFPRGVLAGGLAKLRIQEARGRRNANSRALMDVLAAQAARAKSKYRNHKTVVDGIVFSSKREATRYIDLKHMVKLGLIEDLRLQVPFELAPSVVVKGRKRPPIRYFADFVYQKDGQQIVEDSKGAATAVFKIKRHLMMSVHGIEVIEV